MPTPARWNFGSFLEIPRDLIDTSTTTDLGGTGTMQLLYWLIDWMEGLVGLVTIGMEG